MSESQRHGFDFERIIRQAGAALKSPGDVPSGPGPSQMSPSYTSAFDIAASDDPAGQGIPTCIKLAKRGPNGRVRVDMADARRALALSDQPVTRLLVGVFHQAGNHKQIDEVREYLITSDTWKDACGGVDPDSIAQFHRQLAEGTPQQAREFAKARKAELAREYPSALQWSPKIDSKKQRRLQCSIYLDELDRVATNPGDKIQIHRAGAQPLWGVELPLQLNSPPRVRHKKGATDNLDDPSGETGAQ